MCTPSLSAPDHRVIYAIQILGMIAAKVRAACARAAAYFFSALFVVAFTG